jgi:hypothetical protein
MKRLIEGIIPAFGWNKPSEVRSFLVDAYNRIHSLKADFDRMEEIPSYLEKAYSAVLKAADTIGTAQQHVQNVDDLLRHARKVVR